MKKTLAALILCTLFLGACVATSRSDKPQFASIQQTSELTGVYKNRGQTPEGRPPVYLSSVIWADDHKLEHAAIETIDVVSSAPGALQVKAFSREGELIKSSQFIEGQDFRIENGRISLKSDTGMAGLKTGEPLLGAYHGVRELGIDISGQGKYRSRYYVAGLVYLVVPTVADVEEDVHFEKISAENK